MPASTPPVPYDATAVRPAWADLPAALRAAIADRLGSPIVLARTAGGGFTNGFTAVLHTAAGERVFVKAASWTGQRHLCDWYAREAALTAALPAGVAAPRPRWTLTAAGHFVSCLNAVDGRMPVFPWRPDELDAALATYAATAAALREPPAELATLGLPRLADLARTDLSMWRAIALGQENPPTSLPYRPEWLPELVAVEALLPDHAEDSGVIHCDLRLDNILIERTTGRAWICDWTWLCRGPAWFDLAGLLVTAYASGLDADALFAAHPVARTTPPDGLDAALAALAGYWLTRAADEPSDASPHLRHHERWCGETALNWLADRRRWG